MRKMIVYIAASSARHSLVGDFACQLEASGLVEFSFRWWTDAPQWTGRDRYLEQAKQAQNADICLESVARADVIWCMFDKNSSGSHYEFGAAIERKRILGAPYIVLTGPGVGSSIFHGLVDYRDVVHSSGCKHVLERARRQPQTIEPGDVSTRFISGLAYCRPDNSNGER